MKPQLEGAGGGESERLAAIDVGQGEGVAREHPELPHLIARPVREAREDLRTLNVGEHRECTLAGDGQVLLVVVDGADRVVSTRAVYSLFGSKEGLLVDALAQEAYTLLADGMEKQNETDDPVADLVELGISLYRQKFVVEHPGLYRIAFQRVVPDFRAGPELTAARERALAGLMGKIQRVADAGLLGSTSVRDGAVAFNAMAEGLANSELRGTTLSILPQGDEERAWRDALAALVRGFNDA